MIKRIMALAVALPVLLTAFAGCTGGTTGKEAKTTEAPKAAGEKSVKISWLDANAYAQEKMDALLGELKKDGIEVEIEHVPNDYDTVLKTKFNSGELPDVWDNQSGAQNKTFSEYSYDWSKDEVVKKFNEKAVEQCKYGDKIIGLPWSYETYSILYNKKLFADAGITKLPATMKELEEVCKALKTKGITPFANGYKEFWILRHLASHFIAAEGKSPQEIGNDITSGKVKFADLKFMKNAFDFIDLTLKYGQDKPLEGGWEEIETQLAQGKAAMIHMGDWCEPTLKKVNPNVEVGFIPLPISDNPEDARVMSNISWVWKVNKDSKNLESAKKALEYFLTSDKGAEFNAKDYGCVTALKESPYKPSGMLANNALEYISKGKSWPWPQTAWPEGFDNKFGNLFQAYVAKDKTRDQVLTELTDTWTKMAK